MDWRLGRAYAGLIVGGLLILLSLGLGVVLVLPGGLPTPTPYLGKIAQGSLSVGQPAPDFSLRTLDGQELRLSDQRGKLVLINFWATWCGPCRLEMPVIEQTYQTHSTSDLIILAVNTTNLDNDQAVDKFVSELEVSFPVLLDENGAVAKLYLFCG